MRIFLILIILASSAFFVPSMNIPKGDPGNGGLFLPDGFQALVVVDSLPARARHLAINANGDIYVKGNKPMEGGANFVLRDLNNDGKADSIRNFGPFPDEGPYATSMRIHNGYLYTSSQNIVYRYKLTKGDMIPASEPEIIVVDSGRRREHDGKPLAFDNLGNIYVPFGGPSDACQEANRVPNSPGKFPCPLLDSNAGVWKFKADQLNQFRTRDGIRVATGLRSIVAMQWNKTDNTLYAVGHGRDGMGRTWPQYFSPWESAMLPSEAFYKLKPGADAGWPYYYYDQIKKKVMRNPEYGGDGKKEFKADTITKPIFGFGGHWAPNDLLFYTGNQFPERYKKGAFVAFHGSTDRAPYPQAGYIVAFIPFENGRPTGTFEVFADGFAGADTLYNTSDALYRPMGLAQGPDGSLYISESNKGKIWRVMFKGDKTTFGSRQLAKMKKREQRTYVKVPDEIKDNLDYGKPAFKGQMIYQTYCRACHQRNGKGDESRFPPLVESEWVDGENERLISVLLKGMNEPIMVAGKEFSGAMPAFNFLTDQQLTDLLNYVRTSFSNKPDSIKIDEVTEVRKKLPITK
jgi:glucose/arabinose dehydrogenase/mono/diheme cytochrome c family protein